MSKLKWILTKIYDIISHLKPLSELGQRIKELEDDIKPYKEQWEQAQEDAHEAVIHSWHDKFAHADGRMRDAKREINKIYTEFGKAVHNAYRYKN
jgi:hypothetical protein